MNDYQKGRNEEEQWTLESIPISNFPPDVTWMKVNGGSKIRDLLSVALKKFESNPYVLWSASGSAVCKAITCVEIMKRDHPGVCQTTKICYRSVKEYWDPKMEGLDQLVVHRRIPAIHILLWKK